MLNESLLADPLLKSFALNVFEALRCSDRNLFKLHRDGMSIGPQTSTFFVGLSEMHRRYYLSFSDLEETVDDIRTAFGLFLLVLSPACRLRMRVSRGVQTWTLSEWACGSERRVLAECGYPSQGRTLANDEV